MMHDGENALENLASREMLEVVPRVMRQIRNQMRAMAKPQLTIAQLRILARLYRAEVTTVSELADWMGVSAPAMSKMVTIVEGRGLLERSSKVGDRRLVGLKLTGEGKKVFLNMRKAVRIKVADRLRELPDGQKQVIIDAMKILGQIYE